MPPEPNRSGPFCLDPETIGAFAVNTPFLLEHEGLVKMLFIASLDGDDHERNYDLWLMPSRNAQPRKVLSFHDCVHNPWVVRENGFFRLYITVMENAHDPARYRSSIRTFTSTDLVNWRHAAGDKGHPRFSENYTVFYALSDDGIRFGEWHWPEGMEPVAGESDRGLYKPNIYRVGPSDYACFVSVVPWLHRFHLMVYRSRDLKRWEKLGPWLPPNPEPGTTHALKATLFRGHLTYALRDQRFRTWIRTVPVNLTELSPDWKRYHTPFRL